MGRKWRDSLIIGFAMFAVFFGAGNLVFPPVIGIAAGEKWGIAILGLTLSGIILPIATILATDNMGGTFEGLCAPVAPWFLKAYSVFFIIFILTVGPPRQAGVGVETGIFGIFPSLQGNHVVRILLLAAYFGIVLYLANNPSRIVDIVGKYLTPFLLVMLLMIVVLAVVHPIGAPARPEETGIFTYAFLQGYQTGDVAVGIALVSTFIASVKAKGYTERKERRSIVLLSALVAVLCLLVVYGGLLYLGATGSGKFADETDQTALLLALVHAVSGRFGTVALGIGIFLACLTTTIGVLSLIVNLTVDVSGGKVPYKGCLYVYAALCFLLACVGVSNIIRYTFAIFVFIYPMAIVLTLLGVFRRWVPNHGAWKGAMFAATLVGIYEAVVTMNTSGITNLHLPLLEQIYQKIPFSGDGFAWLVPGAICFIIGALIVKLRGGSAYEA